MTLGCLICQTWIYRCNCTYSFSLLLFFLSFVITFGGWPLLVMSYFYAPTRSWHDAQAIVCAHTITRVNQEKGGSGRRWKAHPKIKLHGWYKILKNSSRIHFKWFKRIHFKLILMLLFKSLFFRTNLNCKYILLIDLFSIIMQWGFSEYVLSKKIKNDIFSKSAFANRKLIVIIKSRIMRRILQTSSMNTKNKLTLYRQ